MQSTFFLSKTTERIKLKKVDVVIIGAGPSGLSTATTLNKNGKTVLILEKEPRVGGKCYTFSDPSNIKNKTELGAALLAPNYEGVIDKVEEKKSIFELPLTSDVSTIPFIKNINNMSMFQKMEFLLQFTKQMFVFAKHAKDYQDLRDNHKDLPDDYKISFFEFAKKYHLEYINDFSYLFVPAFGYGLMEKCPAYAIFEYYGMMTIPEIVLAPAINKSSLLSIKNGFQSLMEEIASDFNIKLNTTIESINRHDHGVEIYFRSGDELFSISADSLVLAISPLHWPKLGMKLSETEQQCVDNLTYYQYPVAVVKLKGYPAKHYYEYQGLIESGLGHLALITTRDNRENPADGRLCTAYINLHASQMKDANTFSTENFIFTPDKIKRLEEELLQLPEVTGVEILETKVWQDYMSTLPWEVRLALDKQQMANDTHTLYVGSYALGGFDNVTCVWDQANKVVLECILHKKLSYDISYYLNEIHRTTFFFTAPKALPFNGKEEPKKRGIFNASI